MSIDKALKQVYNPEHETNGKATNLKKGNYSMFENAIEIFNNEEFGEIRVLLIDGEPWFVGKDVAEALGYGSGKSLANAVANHVDERDKGVTELMTPGGKQKFIIINESGMYALIFSSKTKKAKEFTHWVTSEVLPSIRKHGAYMTPETIIQCLQKPESLIQLLETLKAEQEKNAELQKTNAALTEQAHEWENKPTLNALIRSYANTMYNGMYGVAWNELYKELRYSEHIDLKIRRGHDKGKKKNLVDYIKEDEFGKAIKHAVALCESVDIDVNAVINNVNAEKWGVA